MNTLFFFVCVVSFCIAVYCVHRLLCCNVSSVFLGDSYVVLFGVVLC